MAPCLGGARHFSRPADCARDLGEVEITFCLSCKRFPQAGSVSGFCKPSPKHRLGSVYDHKPRKLAAHRAADQSAVNSPQHQSVDAAVDFAGRRTRKDLPGPGISARHRESGRRFQGSAVYRPRLQPAEGAAVWNAERNPGSSQSFVQRSVDYVPKASSNCGEELGGTIEAFDRPSRSALECGGLPPL